MGTVKDDPRACLGHHAKARPSDPWFGHPEPVGLDRAPANTLGAWARPGTTEQFLSRREAWTTSFEAWGDRVKAVPSGWARADLGKSRGTGTGGLRSKCAWSHLVMFPIGGRGNGLTSTIRRGGLSWGNKGTVKDDPRACLGHHAKARPSDPWSGHPEPVGLDRAPANTLGAWARPGTTEQFLSRREAWTTSFEAWGDRVKAVPSVEAVMEPGGSKGTRQLGNCLDH
ncbi:hypothetical protein Scep_012411 [Stephania cephalantha]|uniref:Uncharacterized protein n=1 Tax=Stephania cephalantha TaxID=152367 RepID=A0AAP0JF41_9MAGN